MIFQIILQMSRHRGKQQRSFGGNAGGGRGGGGGNKQGKILYNSGEEPAFIRQFKERTGYQAPSTAEDKVKIDLRRNSSHYFLLETNIA